MQGRVEWGGHWAMPPPQESKFYIRYRTESEKSPRTTLDWPKNKGWPPPRAVSEHAPASDGCFWLTNWSSIVLVDYNIHILTNKNATCCSCGCVSFFAECIQPACFEPEHKAQNHSLDFVMFKYLPIKARFIDCSFFEINVLNIVKFDKSMALCQ